VFAALIFTGTYGDAHNVGLALLAFGAMCAFSSATYIVNDIRDAEHDRRHPRKRGRPIAGGAVSPVAGAVVALALVVAGTAMAAVLGRLALLIVATYVIVQLLYNLGLKHVVVADVYTIAVGFVLRAVLGAVAIDVRISGWLLFCTGALALMLGFGKRRSEFIAQGEARGATRPSLVHYNSAALDVLVVMFATAAALCYGVYTLESETARTYPGIILTAPFAFYGITRYVVLVFTLNAGDEPEDLLFRDRHLLVSLGLFVVAAALAVGGVQLPVVGR
jgi:decaprenyl-phosphate phosphoribosyltransferase